MIGYTINPETCREEIEKARREFVEFKNHIDRIKLVGEMFGWNSKEMDVTRAAYREWQQGRRVSHVDNKHPSDTVQQQSIHGAGI